MPPKIFNILTVNKTLKRVKRTCKSTWNGEKYAQKDKISRDAKSLEKNALEDKKYKKNQVKTNEMRRLGFEHRYIT